MSAHGVDITKTIANPTWNGDATTPGIKDFFGTQDKQCMKGFGVDLSTYAGVKSNAEIPKRIANGSMPPGGWSKPKKDSFANWVKNGYPEGSLKSQQPLKKARTSATTEAATLDDATPQGIPPTPAALAKSIVEEMKAHKKANAKCLGCHDLVMAVSTSLLAAANNKAAAKTPKRGASPSSKKRPASPKKDSAAAAAATTTISDIVDHVSQRVQGSGFNRYEVLGHVLAIHPDTRNATLDTNLVTATQLELTLMLAYIYAWGSIDTTAAKSADVGPHGVDIKTVIKNPTWDGDATTPGVKDFFGSQDKQCMSGFGVDLSSYTAVKSNDKIPQKIASNSMPPGAPWSKPKKDSFANWVKNGYPKSATPSADVGPHGVDVKTVIKNPTWDGDATTPGIKDFFGSTDKQCMESVAQLDLSSYTAVKANIDTAPKADKISTRINIDQKKVASGGMPPGAEWSKPKKDSFNNWVKAGCPGSGGGAPSIPSMGAQAFAGNIFPVFVEEMYHLDLAENMRRAITVHPSFGLPDRKGNAWVVKDWTAHNVGDPKPTSTSVVIAPFNKDMIDRMMMYESTDYSQDRDVFGDVLDKVYEYMRKWELELAVRKANPDADGAQLQSLLDAANLGVPFKLGDFPSLTPQKKHAAPANDGEFRSIADFYKFVTAGFAEGFKDPAFAKIVAANAMKDPGFDGKFTQNGNRLVATAYPETLSNENDIDNAIDTIVEQGEGFPQFAAKAQQFFSGKDAISPKQYIALADTDPKKMNLSVLRTAHFYLFALTSAQLKFNNDQGRPIASFIKKDLTAQGSAAATLKKLAPDFSKQLNVVFLSLLGTLSTLYDLQTWSPTGFKDTAAIRATLTTPTDPKDPSTAPVYKLMHKGVAPLVKLIGYLNPDARGNEVFLQDAKGVPAGNLPAVALAGRWSKAPKSKADNESLYNVMKGALDLVAGWAKQTKAALSGFKDLPDDFNAQLDVVIDNLSFPELKK